MLPKDFENFELRLTRLREESKEDFELAEKLYDEKYDFRMQEIFPRDILGAKKYIKGQFILKYADSISEGGLPGVKDIFSQSVAEVVAILPLSSERKKSLKDHILHIGELSETLKSYFRKSDDISRDPFYALIEDFSLDGDISKEEFLVLQEVYAKKGDFLSALEELPAKIKELFHGHIELALSQEYTSKKDGFESEYSSELKALKQKGINIAPVVVFVSRSYYKTPARYRKYEHPKRRLRRTFKLALLRLLRMKLGNIEAANILKRFEEGEYFEDYFMILFQLLEVLDENPDGEEVYNILNIVDETQDEVVEAEKNREKILSGESIVMKLASLFSKTESKLEEDELEDDMLGKILESSTDIVGEEVHFNRNDEMAGIYSEANKESSEESEEQELEKMSPRAAYELLSHRFHSIDEDKRQAFADGRYDDIDIYNEKLLDIQIKLEKLTKILGIVES